jgi:hypothetical protein
MQGVDADRRVKREKKSLISQCLNEYMMHTAATVFIYLENGFTSHFVYTYILYKNHAINKRASSYEDSHRFDMRRV